MALILNIDTSTQLASLSLAQNGEVLTTASNEDQKGHATWIHNAIGELFYATNTGLHHLDAVAITSGPGSYTGLRVGMATAKGLCYALGKPLIAVDTLYAMAYAIREENTEYLCPMMDAGRMEVYTALYTRDMQTITPPAPMILNESSFSDLLIRNSITFCGLGKTKFINIQHSDKAFFNDHLFQSTDMCLLTYDKFIISEFASLAYLEPLYLKEYRIGNN